MIVLDTCALIYDALTPERLSEPARSAIERGDAAGQLACYDISLWEIAMLVERGRIDVGTESRRVYSYAHGLEHTQSTKAS